MERLSANYRGHALHHLRSLLSLERVATMLDDAGVPWLTMKGPVLAEVFYRQADVRRYADLDVLISPHAFPAAITAFEAAGAAGTRLAQGSGPAAGTTARQA